jgi:hypothetical protein
VLVFVLMRVQCRIEAQPRCLVVRFRCLFCCTRHFRTANSTPLISISCHLAPFDKLGWKVITLKGLFKSSAPINLWALRGRGLSTQLVKSLFGARVNCILATCLFHRKSRRLYWRLKRLADEIRWRIVLAMVVRHVVRTSDGFDVKGIN